MRIAITALSGLLAAGPSRRLPGACVELRRRRPSSRPCPSRTPATGSFRKALSADALPCDLGGGPRGGAAPGRVPPGILRSATLFSADGSFSRGPAMEPLRPRLRPRPSGLDPLRDGAGTSWVRPTSEDLFSPPPLSLAPPLSSPPPLHAQRGGPAVRPDPPRCWPRISWPGGRGRRRET